MAVTFALLFESGMVANQCAGRTASYLVGSVVADLRFAIALGRLIVDWEGSHGFQTYCYQAWNATYNSGAFVARPRLPVVLNALVLSDKWITINFRLDL
jgi:hypothetical protein